VCPYEIMCEKARVLGSIKMFLESHLPTLQARLVKRFKNTLIKKCVIINQGRFVR
jgi:hypothetical protein